MNKPNKISISFVAFNDGRYTFYLKGDTHEVSFEGSTKAFSEEDFDFLTEVAPACVFTDYKETTYDKHL